MGIPPYAVIFGRNRLRSGEVVRGAAWVKLMVVPITLAVCLPTMRVIFDPDAGKFPAWAARP